MKWVLAYVLFCLVITPDPANAQRAIVNGTVVNENGEPLTGANVAVAELLFGVSTDLNGQYTLSIPGSLADGRSISLRVQSVGYVGTRKTISLTRGIQTHDFLLEPDLLMLDEVVVGLNSGRPGPAYTYSMNRLDADDLQQAPGISPIESLQGKVAGVAVIKNSGAPGDGIAVRLRGSTSVTGNVQPLYIIDDVILGADPSDIDALDVKHIEVIKGAAGATHYGSRGQAGVVRITTRRGQNLPLNQTRITLRNEFGLHSIENEPTINQSHNLRISEEGTFLDNNDTVVEFGQGTVVDREINGASFYDNPFPGETIDAFGQFFDPGNTYSNFVSISRNSAKTNFHSSFINLSEAGVLTRLSGYSRQTVRLNVDHRVSRLLSFSATGSYAQSSNDTPNLSTPASLVTLRFNPIHGVISTTPLSDLLARDESGELLIQADPLAEVENPIYILENAEISNKRKRALGNVQAHFAPAEWITLNANFSYDRSDRDQRAFYDVGFQSIKPDVVNEGFVERQDGLTEAMNYDVSAVFQKAVGGFILRSQWHYTHEDVEDVTEFFTGQSLDESGNSDPSNMADDLSTGITTQRMLTDAYFGRVGFDYKSKLFAEGLLVREGSSLFGEVERWQMYFGVSGAYRVSQEDWWPLKAGIPEFKLRASYGTAGGRPRFDAQYRTFGLVDGNVVKRTLGNKLLKPEHTTALELGVDLTISDRLFMELVYAGQTTKDLLFRVPLPGFFGFESQWQNAGTLESESFEVSLYATLFRTRHMAVDIGVVYDRTTQKITNLNSRAFLGGPRNSFFFQEDRQLGAFYGNKLINKLSDLPEGVDERFFDVNDDGYVVAVGQGNSFRDGLNKLLWGTTVMVDGAIYLWGVPIKSVEEDGSSLAPIGNALPDFNVGIPINFRYKGFNARVLWNAQIGGEVYNFTNQSSYVNGRSADQDQAGKPDDLKKSAQYYEALYDAGNINTHFVEDGSFIRLRELSLSYTFDRASLSSVFGNLLHHLTLSVVGRNLFTITDYSGFDPEVGTTFNQGGIVGADATLYRVDNFGYPNYRTISGRLEIQF